ncbi:UDP-glucuronic acid decarboxylase family protein [Aliiruegeria sabulilitoris]|uniref:UDP-glucuronic acid decarboxylase family protein n=1 Tax=Aliiruegeria sabulilitoris TaxID=1510458 RepID=UPI00082FD54D|nr:UDP-glucuronic acid decarboxylase family protein [Aliiruegeria sabulilitoris]NDR58709.1 SDR family oxidoreductase [Pseudoruegeria sp. M32A2M]
MDDRSVLIAGGAGFLGSHLCKHYLDRGARVICVDNLSSGRMRNIEHLLDITAFRFVLHDITDPLDLGEKIDFIINMAAPASPPRYQADPIATFDTIVIGSENLLKLARKTGARILQASTSEVYGDPEIIPQTEEYCGKVQTMGPRACYDESKRAAETLFYDFHHTLGVDIRVARIFNTYGPNMDPEDGRVVSNFIVQALSGSGLTVYGDGHQTRSFCYVDDMITGLTALMHSKVDIFDPVNLGNPGEFSILELAKIVLEETQSNSTIEFRDLPKDDPEYRRPDISKARRLLDWSPDVPLREGLRQTIIYLAAELGRNARPTE